MEQKPLLRVAGPAWELARFFLFVVFLAGFSSGSPEMPSAPWVAAVAAGGLAMPAAFLMIAAAPGRYAAYLPLLRFGKILQVATVALLYATGTILWESTMPMPLFRVPVVSRSAVVFGLVILADLAVLAGLFRVRAGSGRPGTGPAGTSGSP